MTGHRPYRPATTVPGEETRGGDHVDWDNVVVGEPLPERAPADYPEPDSQPLPGAGEPGGEA